MKKKNRFEHQAFVVDGIGKVKFFKDGKRCFKFPKYGFTIEFWIDLNKEKKDGK
jgi:hypothetical protein